MSVSIRTVKKVTILDVDDKGEEYTKALEQVAETLLKENLVRIIVNLDRTEYFDSRCIAVLTDLLKQCRHAGGDLKLINVKSSIMRLLEITSLNKVFEMFDNEEDAINSFQPVK